MNTAQTAENERRKNLVRDLEIALYPVLIRQRGCGKKTVRKFAAVVAAMVEEGMR
jgi:hypothetical protein